jgi:hypothetical protein
VLKAWKKQNRQIEYANEVKKQAQIDINPEMLSEFKDYFKNKPVGEFDKNDLAAVLSRTLFTYHIANTLTEIPVARFIEYYNTLPIRKVIRDVDGMVFYIEAMVYDEYAFEKAGQLGITSELKFLLDKENYKRNVIWAAYENKELKKGITVSGDELLKKYEELKNSFTEPTDVTVSVYGFADRMAASAAAMNIKSKRMELQNLKSETLYLHTSINYKNDRVNEVMMPSYFNGKFVVVIKESEAGKRIKTLPEVKTEIIKKIENEKLEDKKQIYLKRLKTIYPLKNEIRYQKYLGISKTM